MRPRISGIWWQIAGNPDLDKYTTPAQEPVDFAIWQADDSTWHLWSCVRNTACGGMSRLFYRWEGVELTQEHWEPRGIAMEARVDLGETEGGLQAPHVIKEDGSHYMFYGDFDRICLARSDDGRTFVRTQGANGQPDLFSGPYEVSRDAMVMKFNDRYYCYYTGHKEDARPQTAVFCRTSTDMRDWSDPIIVSAGGAAQAEKKSWGADCECPFVVERNGLFCLFRNQRYGKDGLNTQYCSPDPLDFGVDDDRYCVGTLPVAAPEIIEHAGRYYMAALMPGLDGIRIVPLEWDE